MGLRLRHVGAVVVRLTLLISLLSLLPQQAAGQELSVDWLHLNDENGSCVEESDVAKRVEGMLSATLPAGLHVNVDAGEEPGFSLGIDGQGRYERAFSTLPEDCTSRTEALAVAIAIAIENLLAEESTHDADQRDEGPPRDQVPLDEAPANKGATSNGKEEGPRATKFTVQPSSHPHAGWSVRPFLGVGALFGVLPRPAFVPEAGLDIWVGRFSWGLSMLYALRVRSPLESGRVTSRLVGATLHGCREAVLRIIGFSGCLRLLGGSMRASATGLPGSGTAARSWWAAGGAGAVARLPARGPVGVQLGADLFANFLRPGVKVDVVGGDDRQDNAPILGYRGSTHFFFLFR